MQSNYVANFEHEGICRWKCRVELVTT